MDIYIYIIFLFNPLSLSLCSVKPRGQHGAIICWATKQTTSREKQCLQCDAGFQMRQPRLKKQEITKLLREAPRGGESHGWEHLNKWRLYWFFIELGEIDPVMYDISQLVRYLLLLSWRHLSLIHQKSCQQRSAKSNKSSIEQVWTFAFFFLVGVYSFLQLLLPLFVLGVCRKVSQLTSFEFQDFFASHIIKTIWCTQHSHQQRSSRMICIPIYVPFRDIYVYTPVYQHISLSLKGQTNNLPADAIS